jgi:hypothetical protein
MKYFSLYLACMAAVIACGAAEADVGNSKIGGAGHCSKQTLKSAAVAISPKLLPGATADTGVIEIEKNPQGLRRLAWNFHGGGHETASVACYRGNPIAVQVLPSDARCQMSIRKRAPGMAEPAFVVEKLICE